MKIRTVDALRIVVPSPPDWALMLCSQADLATDEAISLGISGRHVDGATRWGVGIGMRAALLMWIGITYGNDAAERLKAYLQESGEVIP